jgi:signal transduction histidine kinase
MCPLRTVDPALPAELRETLFDEGVSTKITPGHGLGLALARQAARARGRRLAGRSRRRVDRRAVRRRAAGDAFVVVWEGRTLIRTLIVDDDFRVAGAHAGFVEEVFGFTAVGTAHTRPRRGHECASCPRIWSFSMSTCPTSPA